MDGCIGVFEVVKFHTKRHRAQIVQTPVGGLRGRLCDLQVNLAACGGASRGLYGQPHAPDGIRVLARQALGWHGQGDVQRGHFRIGHEAIAALPSAAGCR